MEELTKGTKINNRYTLKEFKGNGSFGEVWLAHDEVIDCDVAIKIYLSLDPHGIEEFKSEYITTQGISHPNLLTTSYFDVWQQRPFLVMKYCAKGSSSNLVGKIDEHTLWQFIHDVSAGLKYLHNMSDPIIHQDIKPDNILVDDSDHYLITDFGISKKIRSTMRKQSQRAMGAGATAYMAPEKFESTPILVKASDIWSLGASIYELATGELPFCGLGGGMQKNGAEIPSLDNKWSKGMNMVMQSCLAKETWDRPTAQQLEEYSEAIIKGQPVKGTWNVPSEKVEEPVSTPSDPYTSSIYENDDKEETHSNKKRVCITIVSIVAAIILLYFILPLNKTEEPIIIPKDNIDIVKKVKNELPSNETIMHISKNTNNGDIAAKQTKVNNRRSNISSTKNGTYSYSYGIYQGEIKNGKPNGKGKLTFSSKHTDNMRDYSADNGDYIDGYFSDGNLDHGTLYNSTGLKIKVIY